MSSKINLSTFGQTITDFNPNPVIRISKEGILEYANTASKYLCYFLGISINSPVPEPFKSKLEEARLAASKVIFEFAANKVIYLVTIVQDPEDQGFCVFCSDVSVYKQSQTKLKESDDRFRLLAQFASDLISRQDSNGNFLYVSPASLAILGYNAEELLGKSIFDFIVVEDKGSVRQHFLSSSFESGNVTYQMVKKDSSIIYIESKYQKYFNTRFLADEVVMVSRDVTDRVMAEKKLQESELRISNLLSVTTEAIVFHSEGTVLEANERLGYLLGVDTKDLINKSFFSFLLPEDFKIVQAKIRNKDSHSYEINIRRMDGTLVPVEITGKDHIYKGQPVRVAIIKDISERKKAELKILESESRYRSIVESAQEFIYTADPDGNFTYLNPVGLKKIKYSEEEIIGKSFETLVREDWRETVAEFYKHKFLKKITDSYLEFPVVSKDGEEWWVGQNVHMLLVDGKITGFQANARDITERRVAEEELRKQQELIQSILDHLPFNIFLKNSKGEYLFANKRVLEFLNVTRSALIGKKDHEVFSEELVNVISKWDKQAWANKTVSGEEKHDANGEQGHHMVGLSVLETGLADEPLLLGYSIDITSRKKVEEELIKAKQQLEESIVAKEKFISIMSHEIRTPMNAVVGITNLLLQKHTHSAEDREYFNSLKISSESLLKILNNVLDLSKIESGKIVFEQIDFSIPEALNQVKELFSFPAFEKQIRLEVDKSSAVPDWVSGDSHRLNQILVNLMSNAIKFTEKGQVKIEVALLEETDNQVHLKFSVTDTGIGIATNKIPVIFESFTQADSQITRKYGGTGLGLTITKRLIELQGGSMEVSSEVNKGSVFSFDLRFQKSEGGNTLQRDSSRLRRDLSGLKALIVEDNRMNQLVVCRFLEKEKIFSEIAENGKIAVEMLQQRSYDFVLMDLQMPEMDGFEASAFIRNQLKLSSLPIIAFTASSSSDIERKVLEAGMNDYIVKPFDPDVFYAIIARHTNRENDFYPEIKQTMSQENKLTDLTYLRDASGGNKEFIKEMVEIFLKQTPLYMGQLEGFCQEQNWTEFRKIMHKLKPTITMMGIKEGEKLVKDIEHSVKGQVNIETVPGNLQSLKSVCEKSFGELRAEIQ